jgi:hypothetical protein
MMDGSELNPLNALDWLEFFANQKGWDSMAERIAADSAKLHERQDDIADEMDQLRLERDSRQDRKDQNAA